MQKHPARTEKTKPSVRKNTEVVPARRDRPRNHGDFAVLAMGAANQKELISSTAVVPMDPKEAESSEEPPTTVGEPALTASKP